MADGSQDSGEKTEDPSQSRIEDFRKKGDVASSKDLTNVVVLFATMMTLILSSIYMLETMMEFIEWLYGLDAKEVYLQSSLKGILMKGFGTAVKCIIPVVLSSMCIGVLATVAQIGFLFSPEVIKVKFDKVNPIKGFQKFMSIKPIIEAIKGIFKFIVVFVIGYVVFSKHVNSFSGFLHVDALQGFIYGKTILSQLAFSLLLGLLIIAIGDYAWVKYSYNKKIKMTKQEVKQEMKEKEGNPEVKQRIRMIQREMAQKRMMENIQKADVIVTNPTHISVAIKYDLENMIAPEVVAMGSDHLALSIREMAKKFDVPIVENVHLARTLYQTVKVGSPVPRTLYKAIAEILAFVYRLKKNRKALSLGE